MSDKSLSDMSMKEMRRAYPSGWMTITQHESIPYMIDAFLDYSPAEQFTKKELASQAGLTPKSVRKHIDVLLDLGIVESVDAGGRWPKYTLNAESPITQKIVELNSIISDVQADRLPESHPRKSSDPVKDSRLYNTKYTHLRSNPTRQHPRPGSIPTIS